MTLLELDENILAIDIGKGTEDMFYFEPHRRIENCIQVIKPSYAQLLRQKLDSLLNTEFDIYIEGTIMGGEPWHIPLYQIAQMANRQVIMSSNAARSLRYNLDQVKSRKILIQDPLSYKPNSKTMHLETMDIDFLLYKKLFKGVNIDLFEECDVVLLACQEHGYPGPHGGSTREFRMRECYQQYLNDSPKLTSLMFHSSEVPDFAWRFKANINLTKKYFPHSEIYIMDSSPAVVLGTMLDTTVPNGAKTVINIGNGHSLVMLLNNNWDIISIWEHHTGSFKSNPENFDHYLKKIYKDELTHEEVLQRGGHGFYKRTPKIPQKAKENIIVLGPNRDLLKESDFRERITWSHPIGSMMLSGPAGLLKTYEMKSKISEG